MVEFRLRWFDHVWRRSAETLVRSVDQMENNLIVKGKERSKKTIDKTIKNDLIVNNLSIELIHDRPLWRRLIYVADLT